ncbi:MFS transporter [Alteromonas sp. a30]|uniref:MFS transporter n=1 Tax=Alteromonas sp. a30 TaxID=2730917 RepID=UPI0022805AF2|nr:MFS transporter [Alteromonas sp. a30]MCY7295756.1 MFS transporter [Alteromonas sp. a30]
MAKAKGIAMKTWLDFSTTVKNIISLQLVMGLSIGLLFFIGVGESYRVAPSLILTNVCNQGGLLKEAINNSLKLGLPIEFPGFQTRAATLYLQSDYIDYAEVLTDKNQITRDDKSKQVLTCNIAGESLLEIIEIDWLGILLQREPKQAFEIQLLLEDKFGPVGRLRIVTEQGVFSQDINQIFSEIFIVSLLEVLLVPILVSRIQGYLGKYQRCQSIIQKGLYHGAFVLVALIIIDHQIALYAEQIKSQSHSLAKNLAERLSVSDQLGFDLQEDFTGLERLLHAYRAESQDISHVYLLHHGKVIGSATSSQYQSYTTTEKTFASPFQFLTPEQNAACVSFKSSHDQGDFMMSCLRVGGSPYQVLVQTPWNTVYGKIWRSSRNFFMLFIASALISNIFLNALVSIRSRIAKAEKCNSPVLDCDVEPLLAMQLVKPILALGILMDALNIAFLPAYLETLFFRSDWSVSSVFVAYFIGFAVVLIPAGRWAESNNLKLMMWVSLCISASSLFGMAATQSPVFILVLRVLAGIGQGIFFISMQSYLIEIERQNPGVSGPRQLVIGFNVSTVSGAAIGALLMPMLGEAMVFISGGVIGLVCVLYTLLVIQDLTQSWSPIRRSPTRKLPRIQRIQRYLAEQPKKLRSHLSCLFTDIEFSKTLFFIGLPTKALYTGLLIFIMPIFLKSLNLNTELIGQILVFYYFGVLLTTSLGAKFKQWAWPPRILILAGALGSGVGLILIGVSEWVLAYYNVPVSQGESLHNWRLALVTIGILVLGLAHGCIHAPVVSHVTQISLAKVIGPATTATYYRFFERIGHAFGPSLAAVLFIDLNGKTQPQQFLMVGLSLMLMGLAFMLIRPISWSRKGAAQGLKQSTREKHS